MTNTELRSVNFLLADGSPVRLAEWPELGSVVPARFDADGVFPCGGVALGSVRFPWGAVVAVG